MTTIVVRIEAPTLAELNEDYAEGRRPKPGIANPVWIFDMHLYQYEYTYAGCKRIPQAVDRLLIRWTRKHLNPSS